MGQVVIAVLNRPQEAKGLLEAGCRLLGIGGGGRLQALAVRMPPAAAILPSEEVLTASREAAIRAQQESWAGQLHTVVQEWSAAARPRGVQPEWLDAEGDAADIVAEYGRQADAIVLARPASRESERVRDAMHAALFATETPVLVVPPGFARPFGNVVAIAWNNDQRAVKAVRAGLAILRQAAQVHVLSAGRPADMPVVLRAHDIPAALVTVPEGEGPVGVQILQAAQRLGADLLVMGAFAHGEWRERIFGGVTRTVLAHAELPVFMRH